jgi:hypothetical protein
MRANRSRLDEASDELQRVLLVRREIAGLLAHQGRRAILACEVRRAILAHEVRRVRRVIKATKAIRLILCLPANARPNRWGGLLTKRFE